MGVGTHDSIVSSRVVCHSAGHLCDASRRQHRKTSMLNFFFSSYTTSSITSVTLANRSTEAPLYKLSNKPKRKRDNGICLARCNFRKCSWSYSNSTPAFMMKDYCDKVKQGKIKTILPQFSLTVHTILFVQSSYVQLCSCLTVQRGS